MGAISALHSKRPQSYIYIRHTPHSNFQIEKSKLHGGFKEISPDGVF